ncbi:MAG TPA: hypothetical protein VJN62_02275 [Gemmatimonadales bacterium]|nr:hypothetical protein [Gemmatimonadales bacterium]
MSTVHLDRDGDRCREEPGRYRAAQCRECHGTIWRAIVRERDGIRRLRCSGCGHIRSWPWQGVTFEPERAA